MTPSSLPPAIEVKNLTKRFRYWSDRPTSLKTLLVDLFRGKVGLGERHDFCVLDHLNFRIEKGEFVGIMGRNGAGKSTLLKLLSRIYTPTSGSVEVRGEVAPLIEVGAGFHLDLSGYENIFLNAAILGFGRKAIFQSLDQIIEFSELAEKIHMPVKHYSSGMLVRLGFSIAAHLNAPILLCDEVLAVGDAGFQKKCLARIKQLHLEGRTIVLITHDPGAVSLYCKRCIVIEKQGVAFDGPATEGAKFYQGLF